MLLTLKLLQVSKGFPTTPTVAGTTSWAGGALTAVCYAINFEVVPSKGFPTTPTDGGTTSWAGGVLTAICYAINFDVVPSTCK